MQVTLGLLSLVASLLHTSPLLLPLSILASYVALAPLFIQVITIDLSLSFSLILIVMVTESQR